MRINTIMIDRIVSTKFFDNSSLVDELLTHENSSLNTSLNYKTTADAEWLQFNRPWLSAIDTALKYLSQIEEDYNCDRKDLDGVWVQRNIDVWDLEDHTKYHRENADIHKDFFDGFSKVINLQVYVSDGIPPEAGTCFWKYTGKSLAEDTINGEGKCATWPYDNWELIEQIPFEPNIAFTYNAGPDGIWHSAPTTEMLLDNAVPTHKRAVIIFRFRYK